MRRFILVDAFAAEELVSTRTLQSDDLKMEGFLVLR